MAAYYNENDPFAAAWLRELISEGLIAYGIVDEQSITEVSARDLRGFDQCHFFAGIGVWSHALRSAGWGDDRQVWTGSCPCQPFSAAGKQAGFDDSRHLWPVWFNLIRECRPTVVFGEQVALALGWFDLVSGDLENEDYACGAAVIGAHSIGAPHIRQRLYFVADNDGRISSNRGIQRSGGHLQQQENTSTGFWSDAEWIPCSDGKIRPVEPGTFPLVNGTPNRVGRLRGYGNAIVAPLAAAFIEAYKDTVNENNS